MNQRIRELSEQAVKETQSLMIMEYKNFESKLYEKFAELIVRECMTTVLKESKWYWDKDEFESANAIQNAARRVKEHFGVEE